MNPHEYDTAAWWRTEALISAEDDHPNAALAAMRQALLLEGHDEAAATLEKWRVAIARHELTKTEG